MTTEVVGKSLGLFKQTVPEVSPMAVLWNPDNVVFQGQILRETEGAARRLGTQLQVFGVRGPDEFDRTFAAIASVRAASLLVLADPVFSAYTAKIADLTDKMRLPAMYGLREHAAAGGLMAYGPNYADLYLRAASYVDKILKGAKLPICRWSSRPSSSSPAPTGSGTITNTIGTARVACRTLGRRRS
jgi:putative ABC transport system substrate-binding protein